MNYLHLINRFWQLHEQHGFSACQCTLYFCLLHLANRMRWPACMSLSEEKLALHSGLSRNTIRSSCSKLCAAGLIEKRGSVYQLLSAESSSKNSSKLSNTPIYKTKNEKQNGSTSFPKLQERLALVGSRYDTGF